MPNWGASLNTLLLVDDDQLTNKNVQLALGRFGYEVETVSTLDDGYRLASTREYALILLDLIFDGGRGIDLVLRLRAAQVTVPIIIYTCHTSEIYEIEAIEAGADGYITKFIPIPSLASRIHGHIRHAAKSKSTTSSSRSGLAFGRALLDRNTREVLINGRTLSLTRKEADILELLSREPHRIVSAREILSDVWSITEIASDRIVHSIIERLQVKLKTEALVFGLIKNHGGRGYSLAVKISSTPSGVDTKCEVVPIPKHMDETSLPFFRTSILAFYSHRRSPRIRRDESSMYSILLVDSDTRSRELLQSLQPVDLHVDLVDTPESARAAVARSNYDLILVEFDLGLRSGESLNRGGPELIAELRSMGIVAPILVYTNLEGESYEVAAEASGADGYVLKKTSRALLNCRLRTYINRYRALRPNQSEGSTGI